MFEQNGTILISENSKRNNQLLIQKSLNFETFFKMNLNLRRLVNI